MTHWAALGIGVVAGTHTATWGMYKDAPHEGFRHYPRSIVVSALLAPLVAIVAGIDPLSASGIVLLFGATYCCERGLTEFYKTFVRFEDQSKYTIPMQFHVFGKVVQKGPRRWVIAWSHVAVAFALAYLIHRVDARSASLPRPLVFFLLGSLGGWLSAFGGAFKDAPIEGFHTLKFFRSPLLAGGYAVVLSLFTNDTLLAALGGLGYTVATIETYKTFFFPNVPRGKFATKPILHPEHLETRRRFVPVYVGIWVFVFASFVFAFRGPLL